MKTCLLLTEIRDKVLTMIIMDARNPNKRVGSMGKGSHFIVPEYTKSMYTKALTSGEVIVFI